MFPDPIEGLWDWYHNGEDKSLILEFRPDKVVTSEDLKNHGTWEYNQRTRILTWNAMKVKMFTRDCWIHKLYYNLRLKTAILYEPKRSPPSIMKKRFGKLSFLLATFLKVSLD